jgi:tRNA(fMet)-specific endonuclease VapC
LQFGVSNSSSPEKNQFALDEFLAPFTVLAYDQMAACEFGHLKSILRKQGEPIGPYDLLIASQARTNNLVLVSNNLREFSKVPGLETDNWI